MSVKVAVVNVYNEILEETSKKIMITDEQGTRYLGALCDPEKLWVGEVIAETLVEEQVELKDVVKKFIQMANENGITVFNSTASTMRWWGYLNGLFPEYKEV